MSFIASLGGPRTNQNSCIIFCCTSLVSQLPTASHRHLLPPLPTLTLMFWRDKGSGLVKSVSGFVYLFPCGFFDPFICCQLEARGLKTWLHSCWCFGQIPQSGMFSVLSGCALCCVIICLCGDARSFHKKCGFPSLQSGGNLCGASWAPRKYPCL